MEKLWGGRFQKETNELVEELTASISFDQKLVMEDIQGSLAHVQMLGECGILSDDDAQTIIDGLTSLRQAASEDALMYDIMHEDIHMNIEKLLTERIGSVAGKLHTGRSRNDQVATDMHLYLKKKTNLIIELIENVQSAIFQIAEENIETILPGYTHLQRAQPISFAHHILAYFWMFERDKNRLEDSLKRIDSLPLGAGALAGTTFPINRQKVAELLGFENIYPNSLDAVSDRDFIVEFLSAASLIMVHLSRLSEELILWSTQEFQFIELDDSFCTGSSMMPQKKNPDVPELVRGKTGRVFGHLIGLLTMLKGLPLAYNKDMQEDKEGMFDTVETLEGALKLFAPMLASMRVNNKAMKIAVTQDYSNATDLADYLVNKGLPFREAHEVAGRLVQLGINQGKYLNELSLEVYQNVHPLIDSNVFEILDPWHVVNARNSFGGTGFEQVRKQLLLAKEHI